jgi:hypothetical protein
VVDDKEDSASLFERIRVLLLRVVLGCLFHERVDFLFWLPSGFFFH